MIGAARKYGRMLPRQNLLFVPELRDSESLYYLTRTHSRQIPVGRALKMASSTPLASSSDIAQVTAAMGGLKTTALPLATIQDLKSQPLL